MDATSQIYALDIETTGLSLDDKLIGLSICNATNISSARWYSFKDVERLLQWLSEYQIPLICWNGLFDIGKLAYDFPQYPLNLVCDVAVYAQMVDNSASTPGFALKPCVSRYLGYDTNEQEIVDYLVSKGIEADSDNFREYMAEVPENLIAKYCCYDSYYTFCLYEHLPRLMKVDPATWNYLFLHEVYATIESRNEGFVLDWPRLDKFYWESKEKLANISETFHTNPVMQQYILQERRARHCKEQIAKWEKSKTGRTRPTPFDSWLEKNEFNITSTTQLINLFNEQGLFFNWDTCEFEYPATTDKGSATLDQDHIGLYGIGGEILEQRGNLKQMCDRIDNMRRETGADGKWHPDTNLVGAKSGRISTPGANLVAFPVDEKELCDSIGTEEGYTMLAADFRSLEPAVQAHLSGDKKLTYAIATGVGKKPYYENGTLWIDDIYLMCASEQKIFKDLIHVDPDEWMRDSETVKGNHKLIRGTAKGTYLSTVYGAMPPTVRILIFKHTKVMHELKVITPMVKAFWQTFVGLFMLRKDLMDEVRRNTYLVTEFGFPLTFSSLASSTITTPMHTTLNRMIQSTAAGVMKLMIAILYQHKPEWMTFLIPDWHDAFTLKIPVDKVEEAKVIVNNCLRELNETLQWEFDLMLSIKIGKTLYDTKN
jgi:DNA polymerase I-like protein with 3'-5' exonuclease and polymerase domains